MGDIFKEGLFEKYESEMDDMTLINLYFTTPKNEDDRLSIIKSVLIKRGLNTDNFNESFYIDNIIKLLPQGWMEVVKDMFKELQKNGWNTNIPLSISMENEDFGVSLDEGISLGFHDIGKGNPNKILNNIIEDFKYKFNETCTVCGKDDAELDYNFWVILCNKCSINK